jgi:hypothetical protein
MLVELTNISSEVELNKWHKVRSLDGQLQSDVYVRFIHAWGNEGNKIYVIERNSTVTVEMEYNGINYL